MKPQVGIWKRFIISLLVVERCSLSWGSGSGLLEVYQLWTDATSAGDLEGVYQKFIWGGQMQPQLGIWKRFIRNSLVVDRCNLSWGFGRGLLEVYQWWTGETSAGISKRFVRSLLVVDRCSLSWGSGRGLLEVYRGWTDAASAGDLEEVYQKLISGGQMQPQLGIWKRFFLIIRGQNQLRLGIWKKFIPI